MPISLSPICRRDFFGRVAGGIAGGVAAGNFGPLLHAMAGDSNSTGDQDIWALLSDTHIPGDRNKTGGKTPANPAPIKPVEHLAKIRSDVLSGEIGKPCGTIITGDCVYIEGLPKDYVTLLEEFRPFRQAGQEVHFVMGNHDNRKAFLNAVADESERKRPDSIPDRLCSLVETPKANFLLLDSLEKTNQVAGFFGDEQLDWLCDELDRNQDKPALIFAHHYPDYTAAVAKNPHALRDTEKFFKRIKDRRQVKAYIFGHSHAWSIRHKNEVHLINLPASGWRFDSRQPYAWVLMKLRNDGMTLTLRSIDPEHPKHNETIDLTWR